MRAPLHWDRLPGVTSTTLLQEIKTFLLAEGPTGRVIYTVEEPYQVFLLANRARTPGETLRRQFEPVLGQVEGQGVLRRLSYGNRSGWTATRRHCSNSWSNLGEQQG